MLPFDEEEFIAWRENPITSYIFDVLIADEIEETKAHFIKMTWENGRLDPIFRAQCLERAKLANELLQLEYADLAAAEERKNDGIERKRNYPA
jgi:hypothetical protein